MSVECVGFLHPFSSQYNDALRFSEKKNNLECTLF